MAMVLAETFANLASQKVEIWASDLSLEMLKLADLCPSLPECHNPRKRQEIPLLVARACPRRGRLTSFARHAGAFLLLRTSFGGGPQFSDGNRVVEPAGGVAAARSPASAPSSAASSGSIDSVICVSVRPPCSLANVDRASVSAWTSSRSRPAACIRAAGCVSPKRAGRTRPVWRRLNYARARGSRFGRAVPAD